MGAGTIRSNEANAECRFGQLDGDEEHVGQGIAMPEVERAGEGRPCKSPVEGQSRHHSPGSGCRMSTSTMRRWGPGAAMRGGWGLAAAASALGVYWGTRVDMGTTGSSADIFVAVSLLVPACLFLSLLPGFACAAVASKVRGDLGPGTMLGVLLAGAGTSGMGCFWAWFVGPGLGLAVSAAILAASTVAMIAWGRDSWPSLSHLAWPLALAVFMAWIFLGLAYSQGGLGGQPDAATQTVAVRFWLAPDNKIPLIVANLLAAHRPLGGYLFGGWQVSDRPPLQTGMAMLEFSLFGNRDVGYQIMMTGLQMLWVPALWVLLHVLGFGRRRILIVVIATGLTGAVFVNSVYVWPKMLSGALMLAALAIVVSRDPNDQWRGALIVAGVAGCLAFLSHGSAAFTIIGIVVPTVALVRRRHIWSEAALALVAVVMLYLPWAAFQRLVAPPGDRLLYWQLAGDGGTSATSHPFFSVLFGHYMSAGVAGTVLNKLGNLEALFFRPDWVLYGTKSDWVHSVLGVARNVQLTDLVLAAGPLLAGAGLLCTESGRAKVRSLSATAWFLAVSVAAWVLILFGSHISAATLWQGPYAVLLMTFGLLALCVTYLPFRAASACIALSVAWFAAAWLPGLGFSPSIGPMPPGVIVQKSMVLVGLLGAVGVVLTLAHFFAPALGTRIRHFALGEPLT